MLQPQVCSAPRYFPSMPWELKFLEARRGWRVMGTHIPISSSGTGNLAENKCLKECSHSTCNTVPFPTT